MCTTHGTNKNKNTNLNLFREVHCIQIHSKLKARLLTQIELCVDWLASNPCIIAPLSAIFGQTSVSCHVKERNRQSGCLNGTRTTEGTNSNILARKERKNRYNRVGKVEGFAQHISLKLRRRWLFSAPAHKDQLDGLPRQIRRYKKNEREQKKKVLYLQD